MDREPLVSDERLEAVAGIMRRRFPALSDKTQFVTFIQPPAASRDGQVRVQAQACLAVVSPNPRKLVNGHENSIMTTGSMPLASWRAQERDQSHYAGVPDYLLLFFDPILRDHLKTLGNLRDLI